MDVVVRQGTAADAAGLAALRWRWRVDERGEGGDMDRQSFMEFFISWVGAHTSDHLAFVAEADGRLAGMAWLCVTDRVPSPRSLGRRGGDIQSVYVVPELRGHRLGAQLIEAVIRHARQAGLVYLTVHSADTAIGFYGKLGFLHNEQWMAFPE
jgi:GNAT superfamily N-acetyltransferase